MTDASLIYEIDSSQARTAATDLAKLQAASGKLASEFAKSDKALRDSNGRFKSSAKVVEEYGGEVRRLAAEFNPALNAVYQFQEAETRLNRAVALGVITLQQKDAALERTRVSLAAAASSQLKFGQATQTSQHHVANLGYQLNDIGMMMATGQSPFTLMMQQGPQVAQIFGDMTASGQKLGPTIASAFTRMLNPMTAITLVAIGGAAALVQWGMSALGAAEKARTFEDAIGDLDSASSALKSTQDILKMSVDELKGKYGEFAFLVKEVAAGLAQNQIATMNNRLTEQIISSAVAFDMFSAKMDAATASSQYLEAEQAALNGSMLDGAVVLSGAASQTEQSIRNMMKTLGVSREVAIGLANDFAMVQKAASMEDRIAAFLAIDRAMAAAGVSANKLPPAINDAMTEAKQLSIKMAEGKKNAQDLAKAAPGPGWMGSAISETNMLIGRLIKAKSIADALNSVNTSGLASQYSQYGAGRVAGEQLVKEAGSLYGGTGNVLDGTGYYDDKEKGGGGGGGGKSLEDELKARQDTMRKEFQLEYVLNSEKYALDQTSLQLALDQKLLTEQQYFMRRQQMQSEYYSNAIGVDQNMAAQQLSSLSNDFAQMNQLAGGGYDGLLRAQKAFASASALINAYQAAAQALADPKLSAFQKVIAAGKVLAAGLGFVNAIKGGGKGASGTASSATSAASAAKAAPEKQIFVRLEGSDYFMDMAESLLSQIYEQSRDGRVVISKAGS